MNVLFVCRANKTKMMVEIASIMKERGFLTTASAFVPYYDKWVKYLREQREFNFFSILGTHNIFQEMEWRHPYIEELERIEKEYGGKEIWNIINTEHYLVPHTHPVKYNHPKYSTKDIIRYVYLCFIHFERMLRGIDLIVDFAHVSIFRGVMDLVAEKYGIPFMHPIHTLVKDRWTIATRVNETYPHIKQTYNELLFTENPCFKGQEYLKWFREEKPECVYER